MIKGKVITLFVFIIILIFSFSNVNASVFGGVEFLVEVNSPTSVSVYEGDSILNQFGATITNKGDHCPIICEWSTTMNTRGTDTINVAPKEGKSYFPFDLVAQGTNGRASYMLTVSCKRDTSPWNCFPSDDKYTSDVFYFTYLYNGDGVCTTEKEKCVAYPSYFGAPNDCKCSSDKSCNPTSSRSVDSYGCTTYCGNKIAEKNKILAIGDEASTILSFSIPSSAEPGIYNIKVILNGDEKTGRFVVGKSSNQEINPYIIYILAFIFLCFFAVFYFYNRKLNKLVKHIKRVRIKDVVKKRG